MTSPTELRPFKLLPAFQDYLWGGEKLRTEFHKAPAEERYPPGTPLAESWECSTHAEGESRVETAGPSTGSGTADLGSGTALSEYLRRHPEAMGTHPKGAAEQLPVLIKLIDAKEPLSVQVHPDDDYARIHEKGSLGKTEMWYIVDAVPGAKLIYGLTRTLRREELTEILKQGKIERYLQEVPVKTGDVFYIPAGTVHAIGAGIVVYEVQECSDITYRLFDYHRKDKNGNERALHIDKALDVMNLQGMPAPRQKLRTLRYRRGYASELLCRCPYFQTERMLVNSEMAKEGIPFWTEETSFAVLTCVRGEGTLRWGKIPRCARNDKEEIPFVKGDSIFVPAGLAGMELHGKAELMVVGC